MTVYFILFTILHLILSLCAAEFKELEKWGVKNEDSMKTYIYNGLREAAASKPEGPHYAIFLVPVKYICNERSTKPQLSLHMCAYIIRSLGGSKDAIYYDPGPKCYKHDVPKLLDNLKKPVINNFTYEFGEASEKDNCVFKVMTYILRLAHDDVLFRTDQSQPCRRIDRMK